MTKNLETADTIVKLVLAVVIVVLYLTNVISGPFAHVLMILSNIVIVLFLAKLIYTRILED